jgi:RHS repeat-associated protein
MAYASPDAVTQIANGLSSTTYAYDNNGNLISPGTGSATTTYTYDYANRLIALFAGGATTSYSYDAFGSRVLQTGTTTTYIYPFKWYSVASSTGSGAKYATRTDYLFNGDTLLATVDQQTASAVATGTAKTRYIHPDHLGSTNVVTDENDGVVQTLDYYPYGSPRVSSGTSTNERRKYIGQFSDDSGLNYLQARYQDPQRGQFTSEDPTFVALGNLNQLQQLSQQDQQTVLSDPQQMNAYSYGRDNPVTKKDPNGNSALGTFGEIMVETLHIVTTFYDTGNFVFPATIQSAEQKRAGFGATVLGNVTTWGGYLVEAEPRLWMAGGMLLADVDQWAYAQTCANLVSCMSYMNPGAHIELLNPSGPTIKIVPGQVPTSNGPVQNSSTPASGSNQAQRSSSGGGGAGGVQSSPSYSQFISNLSSFVQSLSNFLSSFPAQSATTNKSSNR